MAKDKTKDNIREMLVSLSPIQALSAALPAINTLISSCIIGNALGSNALAAIGFAGPYNYLVLMFANLTGIGSQLLCGKYIGGGSKEGIKNTFSTTTAMCTVIGLFLALCSFLFSTPIAKLMGAQGELIVMTSDYIKGYALCSMFTVFATCILPFLQLDCAKGLSTVSIVVQLVANVGLNLLNIFVFKKGLLGVGLASSIAAIISVLICVPHFAFKSNIFKFSFSSISKNEMNEILSLGWNSAIIFIWLFLRDRIFNQVAYALGGAIVMSAFTVANNISNSIGGTLQGAVNGPCNIVASVLVGERDVESLRKLPESSVKTIYPLSIAAYVLMFIFAKPLCFMFGAEAEHIATYMLVMRIFNLWFLTNPIKTAAFSVYNALKNVKVVSIINFLGLFVYPCISFACAKLTGSIGILFTYAVVPEVLVICTFVVYYRIKTKKTSKSLTEYIYIPRTFSVPKEDSLAITIHNPEEVVKASEQVIEFCKGKGLDAKKSFYCGLSIEEMAMNTIEHGFPKTRKNSGTIDVRLIYEDGHIEITFRDNCVEFDPNLWLQKYSDSEPTKGIGLKMISKLSQEMNYQTAIGLNVLTVKL